MSLHQRLPIFQKKVVSVIFRLNVVQEGFFFKCLSWKRRTLLSFEMSGPTPPATMVSHHKN